MTPPPIPAGQQADGPSIARVYDYLLGGSHNFAADQEAATQFLARWPDAPATMRANRAFLGHAVRYLAAEAGIRQFLDIGRFRFIHLDDRRGPWRTWRTSRCSLSGWWGSTSARRW